jgi:hypothetical protein
MSIDQRFVIVGTAGAEELSSISQRLTATNKSSSENSPIATRFAVWCETGHVPRRRQSPTESWLFDCIIWRYQREMDMVLICLCTYVADTLCYIEYERRALPIWLICDHLAASKRAGLKASATQLIKGPKMESSYKNGNRVHYELIEKGGLSGCLNT